MGPSQACANTLNLTYSWACHPLPGLCDYTVTVIFLKSITTLDDGPRSCTSPHFHPLIKHLWIFSLPMVWTNATWRVSWSYITFKCLRKHHYGLESIQVSLNSLAKAVLDGRIALEFFFEGQERVCVIAKTWKLELYQE